MKKQTLFFLLLAACISLNAQTTEHSHSHGRKIEFPDIPGYRTLKCDFHIHTVFSDGNVWPTIRVEEALKDGLDAISMTDHIEYQPHKDDIPHPDRNRSFEIAKRFAEAYDILVIRGSEITRSMPPGISTPFSWRMPISSRLRTCSNPSGKPNVRGRMFSGTIPTGLRKDPTGLPALTTSTCNSSKKAFSRG